MFFTIKFFMTTAMLFYVLAFAAVRRQLIVPHIVLAISGFALDLYATYLMEIRLGGGLNFAIYYPILKFHIIISALAIAAFLLQVFLGIYRKKIWHVRSVKFIFFPMWTVSYLSGLYLIW